MTVDAAHKSRWEIAEVVFGVPFLASIALHWVVPLSMPQGLLRLALIPAGAGLFITGAGLIILARGELARYAQPTDPGHPTSRVVKTGVFAISRNPLYLGTVLAVTGIGLAVNVLWTLAGALVSILLCYRVLIKPEEQYLAGKFPHEYGEYMAAVHRWLGRK